jgi:hypothetical protein
MKGGMRTRGMKEFLQSSDVIDWRHPEVYSRAKNIAGDSVSPEAVAKACFEWVRDEIRHSADGFCYQREHFRPRSAVRLARVQRGLSA